MVKDKKYNQWWKIVYRIILENRVKRQRRSQKCWIRKKNEENIDEKKHYQRVKQCTDRKSKKIHRRVINNDLRNSTDPL